MPALALCYKAGSASLRIQSTEEKLMLGCVTYALAVFLERVSCDTWYGFRARSAGRQRRRLCVCARVRRYHGLDSRSETQPDCVAGDKANRPDCDWGRGEQAGLCGWPRSRPWRLFSRCVQNKANKPSAACCRRLTRPHILLTIPFCRRQGAPK